LFKATDHGRGVPLDAEAFAPAQRGGGWGPFSESFLRMNEQTLAKLEVRAEIGSSDSGVRVTLVPGQRALTNRLGGGAGVHRWPDGSW
jgi:hypothetical protein